ncbi:hypothetical protein DRO35_04590 [Candidatus Bathyarchaeota archaeon]|nr:MAG: hypothetical protein DRO35_04590 [Candidatus Bathyarchaeota archaeon]
MGIANPLTSPAHKIGGLYFNGRDAYVDCGNSLTLVPKYDFTVEAWVYPTANVEWAAIVDRFYRYPWSFRVFDGFLHVALTDEAGNYIYWKSGVKIPLNKWSHVAATREADTGIVKVYFNGQLGDTHSWNTGKLSDAEDSYSTIIGKDRGDRMFNGTIDEVRIYNRALSEEEIQLLYSNPDYPLTDGLVLWLPMSEHSGNTVYDLSPYGNHGTIHNAEWAVRAVEHPLHAV